MAIGSALNYSTFFRLWTPITFMWLLMAAEQPLVHSIIARLPDPTLNLAAYGYAFFSMLMLEAPVFMLISASNALVKGEKSFNSFRAYAYPICILFSFILIAISLSGLFYYLSFNLIGLSEELSRLSDNCFLLLAPAPLMVGYRRFHQGILVRGRASNWLALGGVLRLFTDISFAIVLSLHTDFAGAEIACISVSSGIIVEAYFVRWRADKLDFDSFHDHREDSSLSVAHMNRFYIPLALSSIVLIGTMPLCTFFIAKAEDAHLSLACWPVITSFVWLFSAGIFGIQELIIAHRDESSVNASLLKTFSIYLGVFLTCLWGLILTTPLYNLWFETTIGLSKELSSFMYRGICIAGCFPAWTMWQCWLKAHHTLEHTTKHISWASILELVILAVVTGALFSLTTLSGVIYAILGLLAARIASCLYLKHFANVHTAAERAPNLEVAVS